MQEIFCINGVGGEEADRTAGTVATVQLGRAQFDEIFSCPASKPAPRMVREPAARRV